MLNINTVKVSLPLKKKFVIAQGEADVKTNVLAVMNNRYSGEAAGSVAYGPPIDLIESELARGIEFLESAGLSDKSESVNISIMDALNESDIHPVAKSALIGMLVNYFSGELERYPWEILSLGGPVGLKSSTTISIADPKTVVKEIESSLYPIIKVKLGSEDDFETVAALGGITGKEIRIDANGAWDCEKAEELIHMLAGSDINVIEQPTTEEFVGEWPHLKGKNNKVRLFMDEGLATAEDYGKYSEFVDGVNIKMEKSGGIIEAIKIAQLARKEKREVMLGCMVQSSVGIAQSIYMSSLADLHDLDGPMLINEDIATGISYQRETIEVDREIIGGPKLIRDVVEKYIQE
ncbi:MAG: enolase C-terminal domain-like protein [candidate division Zixibacteria bacterium]